MNARRTFSGLALSVLTAAAVAAPDSVPQADDEKLLRSAQVGTDGPALLNYFRQRTIGDADRRRIDGLIRRLGDPSYAVRERATADLIASGLPAIGPLRKAQSDPDVEIARRAERCLERIERVPSTVLSAAAARAIARIKPPGAVGVLLAYLPAADDEGVADEVREALAAVAADGRPDPLLEQALADPSPLKRGAAAEALVRTGNAAALEASRKALTDANADVRLRAGLALVNHAKDKAAVATLIRLLADLPQESGWRVEDVLLRLAGEDAPKTALGGDAAARQQVRDGWLAWWDKNAATADLAKLDAAPAMIGNTLLVLRDQRSGVGKVVELNPRKEVVWKIEGLQMPIDAVVVGRDRVLIAEMTNRQVTERDLSGKVIWQKAVTMPSGVQRLPNGNTLVVSRNQILELDGRQREVFSHPRPQQDIMAAQKLRSGQIVFVTSGGACVWLDAKGKEVKTFQVGRTYAYGGLEVLPNNHVLVTQMNEVTEFDADGRVVWKGAVNRPTSVQRLPNGNTLVSSGLIATTGVVELDRAGRTVWEYKPPDGAFVWRARRR